LPWARQLRQTEYQRRTWQCSNFTKIDYTFAYNDLRLKAMGEFPQW
jgi:hypothetical protein